MLCGTLSPALAGDATLLIAHVTPASGRFSLHGEADRRGTLMAVEEFNAQGGVLGRELVLVSGNTSLDAQQAADSARRLITETRVGFLVGAISSGVAASVSAVCQQYGVLFINTNSSAPSESLENAHRSKFVFDAHGANFNRALLHYALAQSTTRRVVLLTEENNFGQSNAVALRTIVQQLGGVVVGEVMTPESLPDPGKTLAQVAAIPADVVALSISGDNQIKLFAQIDPQVLEKQSWVVGEVDWEELYPAPGIPRPLFGTTWAWNLKTPGTAEFVERYRQRYGNTRLDYPGDVTHAAYLATKALLNAIQQAGTTDTHAVIRQLEGYRATAAERMQDHPAWMDPISHHLQQGIYIARWNPHAQSPAQGIEILGHFAPQAVRHAAEEETRLEPMDQTPHFRP